MRVQALLTPDPNRKPRPRQKDVWIMGEGKLHCPGCKKPFYGRKRTEGESKWVYECQTPGCPLRPCINCNYAESEIVEACRARGLLPNPDAKRTALIRHVRSAVKEGIPSVDREPIEGQPDPERRTSLTIYFSDSKFPPHTIPPMPVPTPDYVRAAEALRQLVKQTRRGSARSCDVGRRMGCKNPYHFGSLQTAAKHGLARKLPNGEYAPCDPSKRKKLEPARPTGKRSVARAAQNSASHVHPRQPKPLRPTFANP